MKEMIEVARQLRYRRDLWTLFSCVPTEDLGGVVEVGVAEGLFSGDILKWPIPFPNVYLVDMWKTVESQHSNPNARWLKSLGRDSTRSQSWHDENYKRVASVFTPFAPRVKIMRMASEVAAGLLPDKSLSLVYIDADHTYEAVSKDIKAWHPKVKRGGIMAFHDFEQTHRGYGVKRAVNVFCKRLHKTTYLLPEDKPEDAGAFFIC